jgi:hypothetical protein
MAGKFKLGMATVWVARSARVPGYVDVNVNSLIRLPHLTSRLN